MAYANPWTPFSAWMDAAMSAGDMALASAQVISRRGQRMAQAKWPLSPRDAKEFTLMGTEKMQAAGEAMLAMFSPMMVNTGALMMRLAQMGQQQMLANLRFMGQFSPLLMGAAFMKAAPLFKAPDWTAALPFGPPSAWSEAPVEAATRAMSDAVQQANFVSDAAARSVRAATQVSHAGAKAVKRAMGPVKSRAKANARRLTRKR